MKKAIILSAAAIVCVAFFATAAFIRKTAKRTEPAENVAVNTVRKTQKIKPEIPRILPPKEQMRAEVIARRKSSERDKERNKENDKKNLSPLFYAAKYETDLDIFKDLVRQGADVNALFYPPYDYAPPVTPLHFVIQYNQRIDIIRFLIDSGAKLDFEPVNNAKQTVVRKPPESVLITALAYRANREIIEFLVKSGAKESHYALFDVLSKKDVDLGAVKYLVEHGADFNTRVVYGKYGEFQDFGSPAFLAVVDWNTTADALKYFIEKGLDVNQQYSPSTMLLHVAAGRTPCTEIIKCLVENGANVNCRTKQVVPNIRFHSAPPSFCGGQTPLHFAAAQNHNVEITAYLIERGADVNAKDFYGRTPLHYAVNNAKIEVAVCLIEHGADINAVDSDGQTPFLKLFGNGRYGYPLPASRRTDLIMYMLKHGTDVKNLKIDVNAQNNKGQTQLHLAMLGWDSNLNRLRRSEDWIKCGANPNIKDHEGNTPLMLALESNDNIAIVEMLLKNGANTRVVNKYGETPLHLAVKKHDLQLVQLLLEKGVEMNIADDEGNTPLLAALLVPHYASIGLIELLIKNKTDVNAKNCYSKKALDFIEKDYDYEDEGFDKHTDFSTMRELLQKAGAKPSDAEENTLNNLSSLRGGITPKKPFNLSPVHLEFCKLPQRVFDNLSDMKSFVRKRDLEGRTPLHYQIFGMKFVRKQYWEVDLNCRSAACYIDFFKMADADFNAVDNDGYTPLLFLLRHYEQCWLNYYNSYLDEFRTLGPNPLQFLIEAGFDPKRKTKDGKNVLHLIVESQHMGGFDFQNFRYFIRGCKIDINAVDADGNTPLSLALKNPKATRYAAYLKENGGKEK